MSQPEPPQQDAMIEAWREDRYGLVLFLLVLVALLSPLTGIRSATILGALAMAAVVARIAKKSKPPPFMRKVLMAGAWLMVLAAVFATVLDEARVRSLVMVVIGVVLSAAPILILRDIVNRPSVSTQSIIGAISVYVLFGIVFAFWYVAVDNFPNTDVFAEGEVGPGTHIYFSYVTLTTLGYGDLSPVGYVPRALVVFESLLGQIFLVTLVARLVTMLGVTRD